MKIFVWGTGFAAMEILANEMLSIDVTAFIDNNFENVKKNSKPVYSPQEALSKEYDAVVVITKYSREIYDQAVKLGFDMNKFVFLYNNYLFDDMNKNYELAGKIFSREYLEIVKHRYHVIRGMKMDEIKPQFCLGNNRCEQMYKKDYNRIRTFELVVDNLSGVPGAVAELGVFKGKFARYINGAFPERICYLLDTFEGFRDSEAEKEKQEGNCNDVFLQRFKETAMEKVLSVMPYPEKIICKQGLFPESLQGLEDRFAFVSLDVDFEQSIYDGLVYFYPRLNEGGYIFIHDYNSSILKGVRIAVERYERDYKIKMAKVPIPDVAGTLVITK